MTPILTAFACILGLNTVTFVIGYFIGRQVEGARRDAQDASFRVADMLLDQRARRAEGADNVIQFNRHTRKWEGKGL